MTIDERLETLERELAPTRRRQRFTTLAAFLALTAITLLCLIDLPTSIAIARQADDGGTVIRARKFVVEDEAGRALAILDGGLTIYGEGDGEGRPQPDAYFGRGILTFMEGDNQVLLGVDDTAGGALLFSQRAKVTARLQGIEQPALTPEELDRETKSRTDERGRILDGMRDRVPAERLAEARAKLMEMFPDPTGAAIQPSLTIFGQGRSATLVAVNELHGLFLFRSGSLRASLETSDESGARLELVDSEGKMRAVIGATETETPDGKTTRWPESSLLLFGPDGKLRWSAP